MGNAVAAQPCPDRFIKLVIPNPAGGSGDLIARVLAEKAGAILGQQLVVENRSGATTTIGTAMVAKAKADGCTILGLPSSGVIASVLYDKLPYNLGRDFVPLVGVGSIPMALMVSATSKLNSIGDLVTLAKSAGGIAYASAGSGTMGHLSAVQLLENVKGTGNHIPFRGNPDALQALAGNQVQFTFASIAEVLPLVQAGKLRMLGVTSDKRVPVAANVPTMKELGFADFNPKLWYAFLAPMSTPAEARSQLQDAFAKAVADPTVQERLSALGFVAEMKNPTEVSAFMKAEALRWGKVIKDNNIKSSD
jgi:tripartite-type tricarboxylate transporter receptor subunit TctC